MRALLVIAAFLLTVFIGDRALYFSAQTIVRHSQNDFVRMYEGKQRTDLLFLGDSRVDRNISFAKVRELTGKSCLDLGLGGNSVLISEALLKDYVERYGNPGMVIMELGHTTVDPATMGEMRIFSYCSNNIRALARETDPTYSTFESVFTSLRFNDPAFWRLAIDAVRPPSSRLLYNTIPDSLVDKWKNKPPGTAGNRMIYRENMAAVRRICDFADAHGIQIRLLIGPVWSDFKRAIANFDDWKTALQESAGSHFVYDYSDTIVSSANYFNDEMHLNSSGAELFVEKLCDDKVI